MNIQPWVMVALCISPYPNLITVQNKNANGYVVNKNVNKSRILWLELGNIIDSKLAQVKNNIPKNSLHFYYLC